MMKHVHVYFLWLLLVPLQWCCMERAVLAQDRRMVDSLRAVLKTPISDSARVDVYNQLIFEYRYSSPEEALRYSRDALALAQSIKYRRGEAEAYAQTGNIDRYQGRYLQGMEYYMRALAISEEIKDTHGIAHAYDLIGGVVRTQGNNERAEQYYLQALPMWQKLKDQKGIFSAYISLGVIQRSLGKGEKAMLYFEDALALAKSTGYKQGQAIALNCLGQGYQGRQNYAAAMDYFTRSLQIKKEIMDRRGQAITLTDMAQVHLALRSYGNALQQAHLAVSMAASIGVKDELRDAYQTLYAAYAAMGNSAMALRYHELYVALKDSLVNSENTRRLAGVEAAYQLQKKQTEVEALQREQEVNKLAIRWQGWLLFFLSTVAVLLLALIWVGYRAYRQKQADNKTLLQNQKEIEEKNTQLNNALEELKSTQEQLIATEKMGALGGLVANVAHEINTPLSVIRAVAGKLNIHLPRVLAEVPAFAAGLSAEENDHFRQLLMQGSEVDFSALSTREERQLKQDLQTQLEALGIARAEDRAVLLLGAGIRNVANLGPALRSTHIEDMLKMAARVKQMLTGVTDISAAADKTRKVVYALKSFSTEGRRVFPEQVYLRAGIESILQMYAGYLRKNITVITNWEADLTIPADPNELEIVWMHIIFNAIQAMGAKGGTLEISEKLAGSYVKLTFTDSGIGIPPDVLPRIFEAFFSTRPGGEGSGLGLYVSKKIIENHAGSIQAESAPGRTRFSVLLPLQPNLPPIDAGTSVQVQAR